MSSSPPPGDPVLEVARYPRLARLRECALALAAREIPYDVTRAGPDWILSVEPTFWQTAREELNRFEAEEQQAAAAPSLPPLEKIPPWPLFLAGWIVCGFFFAQRRFGPGWLDRGEAASAGIIQHGEWWRAITALTLHAGLGHLAGNLAAGLLFAAFLLPQFGSGISWLLILLSGFLGNELNAWIHSVAGAEHHSLGSSTAVFGALGILTGAGIWIRWTTGSSPARKGLFVSLGAGVCLLTFLGMGPDSAHIDYFAHVCGFAVGVALGVAAAALRPRERLAGGGQLAAGLATLGLLIVAWALALTQPLASG